jgi:hypothetical protein
MPSSLPGQREIMNVAATLAIALAMSTDAFAVAIGKGAALHRPHLKEALRTGLIFGVIEGLTPLVGWALGKVARPMSRPGTTGSPSPCLACWACA